MTQGVKKVIRVIDVGYGFTKMIESVSGGEYKTKVFP